MTMLRGRLVPCMPGGERGDGDARATPGRRDDERPRSGPRTGGVGNVGGMCARVVLVYP